MKINSFRGDLSDISAKTATLVKYHWSLIQVCLNIPDSSGARIVSGSSWIPVCSCTVQSTSTIPSWHSWTCFCGPRLSIPRQATSRGGTTGLCPDTVLFQDSIRYLWDTAIGYVCTLLLCIKSKHFWGGVSLITDTGMSRCTGQVRSTKSVWFIMNFSV